MNGSRVGVRLDIRRSECDCNGTPERSRLSAAFYSTNWLTIVPDSSIFNRMVELNASELDTIFHALSDATRRRMLRALTEGERTVSQLAEPFDMSLAAASKHIKALENAGLIHRDVRGRTHVCRLGAAPLAGAHSWLSFYERFWTDRLDALERLLREEDARKPAAPRSKPPAPKRGEKS
jgi:DNA-binding transcriptional ArsR family regulator